MKRQFVWKGDKNSWPTHSWWWFFCSLLSKYARMPKGGCEKSLYCHKQWFQVWLFHLLLGIYLFIRASILAYVKGNGNVLPHQLHAPGKGNWVNMEECQVFCECRLFSLGAYSAIIKILPIPFILLKSMIPIQKTLLASQTKRWSPVPLNLMHLFIN